MGESQVARYLKKEHALWWAIAVVVIACVIWVVWDTPRHSGSMPTNTGSALTGESGSPLQAENVTQVTDDPRAHHPPASAANDSRRMAKLMALIQLDNVPIKFYGIVVDQDEVPLANAKVDWRIGKPGYFSGPPDIKGSVVTDQAGLFTISGETGRGMDIENIAKDGYRQANSSYYGYSYGSVSGGPHIPEAKHPELFILVKNELPKVKYVEGRRFPLVWNNEVNRIPLGVNDLELLVNATRDKKTDQVRGFAWKVEFSIPDAELTEMAGSDAPLAPSNGYQKVFSLYDDATEPNRHVNVSNRILVFRTHSGLFGKILFSLYPDRDKNALYVTTYLNDYGKRNLE